jgi:hypothetical protein
MGWPQWVWIALAALSVIHVAAKDGQPRKPHSLSDCLVGTAIITWLLWMGGFFSH